MEKSVNERILAVEKFIGNGQTEFCKKTGISTETYQKIKNGESIRTSTIQKMCMVAGINFDWVMTGNGKMVIEKGSDNPWENALVQQLSGENSRLQKEVERLWGILGNYLPAKQAQNFRKLINETALVPLKMAA